MAKKLGLMSKGYGVTETEDAKREIYSGEFIKYDLEPCFFDWHSVKGTETTFENYDGQQQSKGDLNSLDYIAISSLGKLAGFEQDFVDYLQILKNISPFIVNDPNTMERNVDKSYLLELIARSISVIPTVDASDFSYSDFIKMCDSLGMCVLKPKKFGERSIGVKQSDSFDSERDFEDYKSCHEEGILIQPFLEGIKDGERSFVYVGKDFSHGICRPRIEWQELSGARATELIIPNENEQEIIQSIFDNYLVEYRVTRFDFITHAKTSMISELEMINPHVWVGRGISEIDTKFPFMLANYLNGCH